MKVFAKFIEKPSKSEFFIGFLCFEIFQILGFRA